MKYNEPGTIDWPGSDVAWESLFDEDPSLSVPHKVHVFVFNDRDALVRACGDPDAGAHSWSYGDADADNTRAVMLLARPVLLSAIAHEATHIALFWARDTTRRKQRAYGWLEGHPESVPELVGNLTAIVWHSLPTELIDAGNTPEPATAEAAETISASTHAGLSSER